MFLPRLMLLSTFLAIAVAANAQPSRPSTGFVKRQLVQGDSTYRYEVFVPAHRPAAGKSPVILFLHGSGECGRDGRRQTRAGLGPYLREHAADFPAIVVFPQLPKHQSWEGGYADMALAELDAAITEFDGDPARTSLTGMSLGGYGTYELATMQPHRFAALVPVCGGLEPPASDPPLAVASFDAYIQAAQQLRHIPTWIFHGAQDDIVPPEQSRRMNAALKVVGGDVRYTEFADANHNAWDPAYHDAALWPWLFAQHLP